MPPSGSAVPCWADTEPNRFQAPGACSTTARVKSRSYSQGRSALCRRLPGSCYGHLQARAGRVGHADVDTSCRKPLAEPHHAVHWRQWILHQVAFADEVDASSRRGTFQARRETKLSIADLERGDHFSRLPILTNRSWRSVSCILRERGEVSRDVLYARSIISTSAVSGAVV